MARRKRSAKLNTATVPVTIAAIRTHTQYERDMQREQRLARAKLQIALLAALLLALAVAGVGGFRT